MSAAKPWTIGELARHTGLPTRTIRFWSDEGLVPPAGRTASGYRTYDAAAAARLELVRTLRELGLDLATVRAVVGHTLTVAQAAAAHAEALDAQIRVLRLQRSVLRAVAATSPTPEELSLVHELARLSASERTRVIHEFVDEVFHELPGDGPVAIMMRNATPDLPDDPTPEQVNAWVELATLVQDQDFRARVRQMAEHGTSDPGHDAEVGHRVAAAVLEHARPALDQGVDPASADAAAVVERILEEAGEAGTDRAELARRVDTFTDARVERYWQLLGVINGWPGWEPQVPAFEWFLAALRAPG